MNFQLLTPIGALKGFIDFNFGSGWVELVPDADDSWQDWGYEHNAQLEKELQPFIKFFQANDFKYKGVHMDFDSNPLYPEFADFKITEKGLGMNPMGNEQCTSFDVKGTQIGYAYLTNRNSAYYNKDWMYSVIQKPERKVMSSLMINTITLVCDLEKLWDKGIKSLEVW